MGAGRRGEGDGKGVCGRGGGGGRGDGGVEVGEVMDEGLWVVKRGGGVGVGGIFFCTAITAIQR